VAQKVDGGGPKNILICIDDKAMLPQTKKHLQEVETLLNVFIACHLHIILIGKA
jgi:hypothetical protein